MKKFFLNNIIWGILFVFILGNVYVFIIGIKLSDEVNHFEKEIKRLKQENINLEKKAYEVESLKFAASMAAKLNFIKQSQPMYIENLKYALNR